MTTSTGKNSKIATKRVGGGVALSKQEDKRNGVEDRGKWERFVAFRRGGPRPVVD